MAELERRVKPRGVPRGAKARSVDRGRTTEYVVGRRVVARVYWHPSGSIEHEHHFDAEGRMHGSERECFEDGRTRYLATWSHGRQHGLQRQWDERGRLVVSQRFVRGTGLDVWFDGDRLSETRGYLDGDRHGFERWWRDRTQVWSENHFVRGVEQGIERQWNERGQLRRGFPRFWLAGERVTRREYARALAADATLPALRKQDDKPARPRVRNAIATRDRARRRRAA